MRINRSLLAVLLCLPAFHLQAQDDAAIRDKVAVCVACHGPNGNSTNPDYLNALWLDDMTRLYGRMKEAGRIDVLDHYLSKEGLTITQFPLMPKKK